MCGSTVVQETGRDARMQTKPVLCDAGQPALHWTGGMSTRMCNKFPRAGSDVVGAALGVKQGRRMHGDGQ